MARGKITKPKKRSRLVTELQAKGKSKKEAEKIAASIGKKKHGAKRMASMAAAALRRSAK